MKRILLTSAVLVTSSGIASAQIYDRGVTRKPNLVNPFVSQHRAKPRDFRTVRSDMSKRKMRTTINPSKPAAVLFGNGPPPDTCVSGKRKYLVPGGNGK